jgi:hypothetical protein
VSLCTTKASWRDSVLDQNGARWSSNVWKGSLGAPGSPVAHVDVRSCQTGKSSDGRCTITNCVSVGVSHVMLGCCKIMKGAGGGQDCCTWQSDSSLQLECTLLPIHRIRFKCYRYDGTPKVGNVHIRIPRGGCGPPQD